MFYPSAPLSLSLPLSCALSLSLSSQTSHTSLTISLKLLFSWREGVCLSLFLSHTSYLFLSLSLSHTHTHTSPLFLSLSLCLTHTLTHHLSLYLSLSLSHTHTHSHITSLSLSVTLSLSHFSTLSLSSLSLFCPQDRKSQRHVCEILSHRDPFNFSPKTKETLFVPICTWTFSCSKAFDEKLAMSHSFGQLFLLKLKKFFRRQIFLAKQGFIRGMLTLANANLFYYIFICTRWFGLSLEICRAWAHAPSPKPES